MCTCPPSATFGKLYFVFVFQLLAAVTFHMVPERPRLFCKSQRRQWDEHTYLSPPVCLPSGASSGPAGLLRPWPRKMTTVLLFYFGLVLINTGNLPLLSPPTTTH